MKKSSFRLSITTKKKRLVSISVAISIVSSPWLGLATITPLTKLLQHISLASNGACGMPKELKQSPPE